MSRTDIAAGLQDLAGWTAGDGFITRTFEFHDFVEAFGWMSSVALVAEKMDHHPNWSNVYRTVVVRLSTHDTDAVTQLDLDLAAAMNSLA